MNTKQLNQTEVSEKKTFINVHSWLARLQQKLTNQQRNRQMYAAAQSSYKAWSQRYGERGQQLLNPCELQTQILPQLCALLEESVDLSPTDVAAALANELRGCASDPCSNFANFRPELADYACLFEEALRKQALSPPTPSELMQAA